MNIQAFINSKVIDENGYFTPEWAYIMQTLFQQLQINLSDEGFHLPSQSAANVLILNTASNAGVVLYNQTTGKGMLNEAGTFKTIVTI